MKVYLAGKITGDPGYRAKFRAAREMVERMGHIALDPSVLPEGMETADYMRICTAMLDSADAIGLLRDWADSPGARCEMALAQYLDKRIIHVDMIQGPVREVNKVHSVTYKSSGSSTWE